MRPWTDMPGMRHRGLPVLTPRVQSLLDLAVLAKLGTEAKTLVSRREWKEIQARMQHTFVDISQNPCRQPWTNPTAANGVSKCLTTGSEIYSMGLQRMVLPNELLFFQGHSRAVCIPENMTRRSLTALAGEGICLPCLGSLIYGLLRSKLMPGM